MFITVLLVGHDKTHIFYGIFPISPKYAAVLCGKFSFFQCPRNVGQASKLYRNFISNKEFYRECNLIEYLTCFF